MHRILIPPSAIRDDQITVTDRGALHHLVRVLRAKPGETLECFDGRGHGYRGTITQALASCVTMEITQRRTEPAPSVKLTLGQALIKPEQFEWVVQKATELGAARILPLVCARSAAQGKGASEQRLTRWRRIAEESTAQSGRCTVPALEAPCAFYKAVEMADAGVMLLPTLAEPGAPLSAMVPQIRAANAVTILIGPEGDFTPDEVAAGKRAGAHVVSLGQATLRSETAAVTMLALVQYVAGVL